MTKEKKKYTRIIIILPRVETLHFLEKLYLHNAAVGQSKTIKNFTIAFLLSRHFRVL